MGFTFASGSKTLESKRKAFIILPTHRTWPILQVQLQHWMYSEESYLTWWPLVASEHTDRSKVCYTLEIFISPWKTKQRMLEVLD
jgi:hypothetical protein